MNPKNFKVVEIRDRATCIVAFAIRMLPQTEEEIFLFKWAGYRSSANPCIILISSSVPQCSARYHDEWRNVGRSFPEAHKYIEKNYDEIKNCQVIDVEFILGEVEKPCKSIMYEQIKEMLNEFKE